ncbi:MAG: glutathione S-transferase family protein [Hyphomicrobiaceae bacterium]|nr:glutathione S-transferase family protein [Hyphomicrobiaceae bacterium]
MRKLTHYPLCPNSRSIRLALAELRLDFELVYEEPWMWRPAFMAINPSGALPVLELDKNVTICGAYAISEYLAESHPSDPVDNGPPPILPGNLEIKSEIRRLVDWFHLKFNNEVTREILYEKHFRRFVEKHVRAPNSEALRTIARNQRYHLEYISFLADHRSWLAGIHLSFADLAAGAHISVLDYLGNIDWRDYPSASRWYARLKSRRSFISILEDDLPNQPPSQHYKDLDY